MENIKFIVGLG